MSMSFGVMMFATEYSVAPGELAAMVEQRGYESLFLPEHTHIPVSRPAATCPGSTGTPTTRLSR
jgi:alkanesulfonate monooxygenase SsuD/methylene tetrahydromethanopterin reductase-like flavin-dependent oxidoreductase (luciferase family)